MNKRRAAYEPGTVFIALRPNLGKRFKQRVQDVKAAEQLDQLTHADYIAKMLDQTALPGKS